MSNKGTFGWKGTGSRALEFPAGSGVGVAPSGRARVRYNDATGQMEVSFNGATYVPFAGGTGGGLGAVADIAALAALDDAALPDGSVVAMASVLDSWALNKSDTTTAVDGITIIASASGSRWFRMQLPNEQWAIRDTWHINALTGDDENDGYTAGTALQSHAEMRRRLGDLLIKQAVTVNVDSNLSEDLIVDFNCRRDPFSGITDGSFAYYGSRTVIGSGTITAVTDWEHAVGVGRTVGSIEAAGLADTWTNLGYVDKMIVSTSGANAGATAWVARDLGGANNEARLSTWWDFPSEVDIVNGTTFDVVTSTTIAGRLILDNPSLAVAFLDLTFEADAGDFVAVVRQCESTVTYWCKFNGGSMQLSQCTYYFSMLSSLVVKKNSANDWIRVTGPARFSPGIGSLIKSPILISQGGSIYTYSGETCLLQNPGAAGAGGANPTVNALILREEAYGENRGNMVFCDFNIGANVPPLELLTFSQMRQRGTLWGLGNTISTYAIVVRTGCLLIYDNTADALPDIQAGAGNDTLIGGAATAYVALPVATAAALAAINLYN